MKSDEQIVVAILCQNLSLAKNLSDIFKQVGVLPYVCTSLEEFWEQTLEETPHLSVVDVKSTNEGNLLFKNHPYIQSEEMPVSFLYEADSVPLLYATYDILNLGLIDARASLTGQVKAILKRYNRFQGWQAKAQMAENSQKDLDRKLSRIVEKTEELKEQNFYQSLLKSLQGRLEEQKEADDFQSAVARVFSHVKEFRSFTFLELNGSGQKLISPQFHFDKYIHIPSLWLGKTCDRGIEFFAQNMASQICLELMGGELMSLLIRGKKDQPDMMVFIRVEGEEFLSQFDWESMERYLSGLYCYFDLRSLGSDKAEKGMGLSWELYQLLDEIKYGTLPESRVEGGYERYALISVDFSDLFNRALSQVDLRFFWQKFYRDFVNGLDTQKGVNFKPFYHSPRHSYFLIEKESLDRDFAAIKNYCTRFPFWRYFEDADIVLGASLKPEVKMVPMSPQAIERSILDESPKDDGPQATTRTLFRPGPEATM